MPFDDPTFLDKTITDLKAGGPNAERARRLLARYVPCGPVKGTAEAWVAWWKESKPYAFASDSGDFCWYIDPLAKGRGMASAVLRGPARADIAATSN